MKSGERGLNFEKGEFLRHIWSFYDVSCQDRVNGASEILEGSGEPKTELWLLVVCWEECDRWNPPGRCHFTESGKRNQSPYQGGQRSASVTSQLYFCLNQLDVCDCHKGRMGFCCCLLVVLQVRALKCCSGFGWFPCTDLPDEVTAVTSLHPRRPVAADVFGVTWTVPTWRHPKGFYFYTSTSPDHVCFALGFLTGTIIYSVWALNVLSVCRGLFWNYFEGALFIWLFFAWWIWIHFSWCSFSFPFLPECLLLSELLLQKQSDSSSDWSFLLRRRQQMWYFIWWLCFSAPFLYSL